MKKCPFCAEEIQEAAIKCKHCGSMLNQPAGGAMVQHGAHPPDRVIFQGAPSWKAHVGRYTLAGALGLAGIAAAAAGALVAVVPGLPAVVGGAVAVLVALGLFGATELGRRATRYKLGARTLDVETGLLSRKIETLQLWRVRDVEFLQSFSERLLGVARIKVVTHDVSSPQFVLAGLPDSRALFDDLKNAIELARQARNVIGVVE